MYQYNRSGSKRGVALYSCSAEFGLAKTLEDCFEDMHDMGLTESRSWRIPISKTIHRGIRGNVKKRYPG